MFTYNGTRSDRSGLHSLLNLSHFIVRKVVEMCCSIRNPAMLVQSENA